MESSLSYYTFKHNEAVRTTTAIQNVQNLSEDKKDPRNSRTLIDPWNALAPNSANTIFVAVVALNALWECNR